MKQKILQLSLLIHLFVFLVTPMTFGAGKIQNEDVKSLTELTNAGGTMAQLINDSKIYVTANGLNEQLSTAITNGDIGGSSGINYISNFKGSQGTASWGVCNETQTFTVTIATPAVFTSAGSHGFAIGQPLTFSTTGALPTGLTAGTTYFISAVPSGTTYRVSATLGGTDVATSGTQSGTHTQYPSQPVSCSSGSLSGLAFTSTSSSPLRTNYSNFVLTQTNSTKVQGQGINYAFTIGAADQAKVLSIQFDYNASTTFVASSGLAGTTGGTGVDSDLEVFIYDVTNSILIPISPKVITAQGSNNFTFKGIFQTNSNSTSYRLIIYAPTTNANATGWIFKFTNVQVGPQTIVQGPAITDFVSAGTTIIGATTTAPAKGTIVTDSMTWKRVGDEMIVTVNYHQSAAGTAGSGDYLFQIPTGYTIDTNKVKIYNTVIGANAQWGLESVVGLNSASTLGTGSGSYSGPVVVYDSTRVRFFYIASAATASPSTGAISSGIGFNLANFYVYAQFRVPIVGWSSTTSMSSDTDSRIISASYNINTNTSTTTNGTVIFPNLYYDTSGSYNTSTGIYTVPVSGIYTVNLTGYAPQSGGMYMWVFKNNAYYAPLVQSSSGQVVGGSLDIQCVAGDTLKIVSSGTNGLAFSANSYLPVISFKRVSGPTTIAQTETVGARYFASSTSLSGSLATIVYTSVDNDSHSAYNNSTGVYTCPATGRYSVTASLLVSGTVALNNTLIMEIQKNGTVVSRRTKYAGGAMTNLDGLIQDLDIRCLSGDQIRIQASCSATIPSIVSSNFDNYFSIIRIGNY